MTNWDKYIIEIDVRIAKLQQKRLALLKLKEDEAVEEFLSANNVFRGDKKKPEVLA